MNKISKIGIATIQRHRKQTANRVTVKTISLKGRNMLVQRHFTPEVARKLEVISAEKLDKLLGIAEKKGSMEPQLSKWSIYAKKVHEEGLLDGLSGFVQECSREIRENFEFKHDQE